MAFTHEPPSVGLPRSAPEAQGISSSAVLSFVEAADREVDAIHSVMLVRHGHVVAEGWWSPYVANVAHRMFSVSKSFTASAVGMVIAEGMLSLDDPILRFFPESAPARPSENLQAMRVRDLLTMSTGQRAEHVEKIALLTQDNLTRAFLELPVDHKPGTLFVYNTPATYVLSAIVHKVTGATMLDYLRPRLFAPLGIEQPTWAASSEGVTLGGIGLSLRTEDIARFGELYLRQGTWQGCALIPASWVAAATARQASNGSNPDSDWDQGYGYQFWRSRHGAYRADGAFGQFCIVMPRQDAVVAMTGGTPNMQGVMNLVWGKLLPAMVEGALRADPDAHQALERKLAGLTLHGPRGSSESPSARQLSGKTYVFPSNPQNIDALAMEFRRDDATLVVYGLGKEHRIECGYGSWKTGSTEFVVGAHAWLADPVSQPVAACGAWTSPDVFTLKLSLYQTPLAVTFTLRFGGERLLVLRADYSVDVDSSRSALLVGDVD
ncbi:MAG TPA: serine hydrolase domain-containing protein [Polyangiaceae bacterium]|nr:serine hydrolase domain-containing protein [Polyangiaceae bacterium]